MNFCKNYFISIVSGTASSLSNNSFQNNSQVFGKRLPYCFVTSVYTMLSSAGDPYSLSCTLPFIVVFFLSITLPLHFYDSHI